jgi:hypothetical protein
MFWFRKNKNQDYALNVVISPTGANQLARITFNGLVKIKYLNVRQLPTGSGIYVTGDEYGNRLNDNDISAIYVSSAGAEIGAPTVTQVVNAVLLNAANNLVFFDSGWMTRNVYFQNTLNGTHILTVVYEIA